MPAVGGVWVAVAVVALVTVVASRISRHARSRARDGFARRDDMARLFDLSRDVLLMTDGR